MGAQGSLAQGDCSGRFHPIYLRRQVTFGIMRCVFLALAFVSVVSSQSVKSCGGPNDHLKNPVIKLTPDPPVKGGTLTIEASGTLDEVEGDFVSNVNLTVQALGVVHASVSGGVPMSISPAA